MDKLTDLEVGTIYDALDMLKNHYSSMSEEELKQTLSGAREQYIDTIDLLHSVFEIIAYESGSVYIGDIGE